MLIHFLYVPGKIVEFHVRVLPNATSPAIYRTTNHDVFSKAIYHPEIANRGDVSPNSTPRRLWRLGCRNDLWPWSEKQ
ncbi:hypothetical protein J6590_054748 [Homalodisca vitripennis]|nr:hypothetical protein J6590_054748 [Homalodisca vitripennis]